MKPRILPRLQGTYIAAEFNGNTSGVNPIGKKVLILTDEFKTTFADDKLEFLPEVAERMNLASESGVLTAVGPDAFAHNSDGSKASVRPTVGQHVYFEKYAGLLVMGNDGRKYRLMDDACIGATYTVEVKESDNG